MLPLCHCVQKNISWRTLWTKFSSSGQNQFGGLCRWLSQTPQSQWLSQCPIKTSSIDRGWLILSHYFLPACYFLTVSYYSQQIYVYRKHPSNPKLTCSIHQLLQSSSMSITVPQEDLPRFGLLQKLNTHIAKLIFLLCRVSRKVI